MGCKVSKSNLKQAMSGDGAAGEADNDKKVLFLGLDNAGKSTLLFQMRDNEFKETVPTVGLNVEQIKFRGTNFTLWDVSGQATRLWKHYFDKIHAVVFVVDSSDMDRLAKARSLLHKCINDAELSKVPILVYANKQDVKEAHPAQEIEAEMKLDQIKGGSRVGIVRFQAASAKSGEGIWEGIGQLCDAIEISERK